jgi:hypothetical protein
MHVISKTSTPTRNFHFQPTTVQEAQQALRSFWIRIARRYGQDDTNSLVLDEQDRCCLVELETHLLNALNSYVRKNLRPRL